MEPRRKSQGCTVEIIMVVRRSMVTDVLPPLIGLGWRWKATTKQMVEEGLHLLLLEGLTLSEDLSAHLIRWSFKILKHFQYFQMCPVGTVPTAHMT